MKIILSEPQFEFVSCKDQFPAFVGGFGSGKSHAAIMRAIALKLKYAKQNVAYYLPTYDLVRTIGFPRFSEVLDSIGIPYKINRSDSVIDFNGFGSVIFRTMDTPERIIGYEVADSLVDELDTLPTGKARDVWNKIISRNRQKKPDGSLNTVGVVTTPEGYRFVYDRWHKQKTDGYRLIKAKTQSNAKHLPAGYIESLKAVYTSNLLLAYLDGEFVNLTAGSVYAEFDRTLNYCDTTIIDHEPLHIGLDFNVTKMAAVVYVLRDTQPHAVMEFIDVFDTPAMCQLIKSRFPGHSIYIYPDASGQARKSNNASVSDLSILRQAGFTVLVNGRNPAIKDRVLATNNMIHSQGVRCFKVNTDACPGLTESLEKQAYDKNGEPDKTSGLDHIVDAATYFIAYKYPIAPQAMQRIQLIGL